MGGTQIPKMAQVVAPFRLRRLKTRSTVGPRRHRARSALQAAARSRRRIEAPGGHRPLAASAAPQGPDRTLAHRPNTATARDQRPARGAAQTPKAHPPDERTARRSTCQPLQQQQHDHPRLQWRTAAVAAAAPVAHKSRASQRRPPRRQTRPRGRPRLPGHKTRPSGRCVQRLQPSPRRRPFTTTRLLSPLGNSSPSDRVPFTLREAALLTPLPYSAIIIGSSLGREMEFINCPTCNAQLGEKEDRTVAVGRHMLLMT